MEKTWEQIKEELAAFERFTKERAEQNAMTKEQLAEFYGGKKFRVLVGSRFVYRIFKIDANGELYIKYNGSNEYLNYEPITKVFTIK